MALLKRLLIIPPLAIGGWLLYQAVSTREPPVRVEVAEPATLARTVTVRPRTFVPTVSGFGTVEPVRVWQAIPQVSGRVTEVNADFVRGSFVPKGTVLVRLATEDYELDIAEAEAAIDGDEADLEELTLNEETLRLSLQIQRDVLVLEEAELQRQKDLLERNVSSPKAVEEQQAALLQQRASVQNLENQLALIPAQRRALETAMERSRVSLDIARLNLSRTVLEAPFHARVADADIEIDQYAAAGASIGTLDGVDAAEVDVQIPPGQMRQFVLTAFRGLVATYADVPQIEEHLARLRAIVELGLDGVVISWPATVRRISDAVDPQTRSIGVIVEVADPYRQASPVTGPPLVKGMFVEVTLSGPPLADAILLPRSAIRDGSVSVVDTDDRLARKAVEIGYSIDDVVLITEGLSLGERVVVSDLAAVIPGMLLTAVDDETVEARLDRATGEAGSDDQAMRDDTGRQQAGAN